jgi:hypothetical protein
MRRAPAGARDVIRPRKLTLGRPVAGSARVKRRPSLTELADRVAALEDRVARLEAGRAPPEDGRAAVLKPRKGVKRCPGCGLPLRRRAGRCAECGRPIDSP